MKKLNLPVVLCKSYGAFFRSPDYNPKGIKGHQEFHYHVLKTNKMESIKMVLAELELRCNKVEA